MVFVRTDVLDECIASIIRVTRIGELVTRIMEMICSSKTSVLTRATQCNIPEDDILYSVFIFEWNLTQTL
jgi:hypothetical protein